MPISNYLKDLRTHIGNKRVLSPAVAALIRDDVGRVLMQKRSDNGCWEIPAGAIDPGEPPARAIIREVYEETGLQVVPERVVAVVGGITQTYPNGDQLEPTGILFACRVIGGQLESLDGEATAFCYLASADMPEQPLWPNEIFADDGSSVYFEWDEVWLEQFGSI